MRSWGLSAVEQDEVWQRWRRGESLRLIARRLGKRGPSVPALVLQTGRVQCPPPRRAAPALMLAEREEISRGLVAGDSRRVIAQRLGRAPSTVSREVTRNGGRWCYRAQTADGAADRRARRPKPAKLVLQPAVTCGGGGQTGVVLVTAADRGMAALGVPRGSGDAGCRTRRSTSRCSCKAVARCVVSSSAVCRPGRRCATHGASACPRAVVSSATSC
jgi:hypothetical protein